ncbi:MAG: COX15/CtaA family protein [Phycisphaeraceae bacterium]
MSQDASPNPTYHPWLHYYAIVLVLATFALIGIGGNVTSLGAGMAVPDGWTSFGHFLWSTPLEKWYYDVGTFWEHSHRLVGSVVGLLTIGLTTWLWIGPITRSLHRSAELLGLTEFKLWRHAETFRIRPWLRWLGIGAFVLVCVQGALGAIRVEEDSLALAAIHGVVGQVFFVLVVLAAVATGQTWLSRRSPEQRQRNRQRFPLLRHLSVALVAVVVVQLVLGAAVRHMQADRAIPDFPANYGSLVPPMTQQAIDQAIAERTPPPPPGAPAATTPVNRDAFGNPLITAGEVHVHYAHRVLAAVVLLLAAAVVIQALRRADEMHLVAGPVMLLTSLLGLQIALGAMVIWSETDPWMATLHQAAGAVILAVAAWLSLRVHLLGSGGVEQERASRSAPAGPADSSTQRQMA